MKISNLNLYVVDDGKDERESLSTLFIARNYRVQAFESGEAFLENADTASYGCVLLDVKMDPGMRGTQVFDELQRLNSPLVVILHSGHLDIPIAAGYSRKGVFECIVKGQDELHLLDCVKKAMELALKTVDMHEKIKATRTQWNTLTPREKDVALLCRHGWTNQRVADELGIGVRAVDTNKLHIYKKMGVSNPTELEKTMRENDIA